MTEVSDSTSGRKALLQRIVSLSRPLAPEPTGASPRLAPLEGIRVVAWDIYGTLLVSGAGEVGTTVDASGRSGAFREALEVCNAEGDLTAAAQRGVELLAAAIESEHAAGKARGLERPEVEIRSVWQRVFAALSDGGLLASGDTAVDVDRLVIEYECRVNPAWPMPGAREVLGELRSRGMMLGIVSNAQFYTPLVLEALFGSTLESLGFATAHCVWSYESGAAKPSRGLFDALTLRLAKSDRITPREVLFVGNDMLNDIEGASAAGFRTALFAGDTRSLRWREKDPRVTVRPDIVITELGQLLAALRS